MSDTGKIVALVKALAPAADQETVDSAVETYLDNHPEATTTVQDGSITEAKLASALAQKVNQVTTLSDEIANIFETVETGVSVANIPNVNAKPGWNAGVAASAISMSQLAAYDTYWAVSDSDIDLYFPTSGLPTYVAITVGNGAYTSDGMAGSNFYIYCNGGSTRYRKSDNNLPNSENKLHIASGVPYAITINAGTNVTVYGVVSTLVVKQTFKNEINKTPYIQYFGTAGEDSSTERVNVYIPTTAGYVKYVFYHTVNNGINANVWRIGYAQHTDDAFNVVADLTTEGEWECAVHLADRDDFSGGNAHGDEIYTNVVFLVNGTVIDISTYTEMTAVDQLTIVQESDLYDPADHTTVFANHNSIHIFSMDGVTVKQALKFITAVTATNIYMAMFPIAKAVSNRVVPNCDYVPRDTANAIRITEPTDGVTIYKTNGNIMAEFSVPKFEYLTQNDIQFMCLDNGGTEYNKCYFVNNVTSYNVSAGKILRTETRYNIIAS